MNYTDDITMKRSNQAYRRHTAPLEAGLTPELRGGAGRASFNIFQDVLGISDPFQGSAISQAFGGDSPEEIAEKKANAAGYTLQPVPITQAAAQQGQIIQGIDNTVLLLGAGALLLVFVVMK